MSRPGLFPIPSIPQAGPSRREALGLFAGAAAAIAAPGSVLGLEAESHGLSIFGDLKYPPDFRHFGYADPAAPKAGTFGQEVTRAYGNQSFDTFNTLHIWVLKGEGAGGVQDTFDTLMARAFDEPDAMYGLIARSVSRSDDGLTYRFRLRPEARFHDGSRLTARDCAFSILTMKEKGHPRLSQELRQVVGAEADGDDVLIVRFAPGRARTCRWSSPTCRSFPRPSGKGAISRRPRWSRFLAPAPIASAGSNRAASSNWIASRIIGRRICR